MEINQMNLSNQDSTTSPFDAIKQTCTFDGCDKPRHGKGLCNGHWQQQRKGQALRPLRPSSQGLTLEQRFWAKVEKTDECWVWTAATDSGGYGKIYVDGRYRLAHRLAWELIDGPVPSGMDLDHRCGNRACVNPGHLRVTTRSQNNQHRIGNQCNNTSGVRGVYWDKRENAWHAQVQLNGRKYFGGYHPNIDAADAAARALRARLHSHDDHHEWAANQAESGTR